ncbi:MAG: EAL domain-containing protein [Deltaproteobacteria bacterium]|nr:EAL domain-containing protein [Deltaproteobacteria bacterium]
MNTPPQTGESPAPGPAARVLVVDDDPMQLRAFHKILSRAGYDVETSDNATAALALLNGDGFDAVVSDVAMPEMDGLDLLNAMKERELSVPVVLVTGGATVETAARAVELGAVRYLIKPVSLNDLRSAVGHAVLTRRVEVKRNVVDSLKVAARELDLRQRLGEDLDRALAALWMAFQPIVSYRERRVVAYEALMRSDDPVLPSPGQIVGAAERLARLPDVGRAVRRNVAAAIPTVPNGTDVFVNLHALDLEDDDLYDPEAPLSAFAPRVVLELTECAPFETIKGLQERLATLRRLGYRIAVDDLGAGYASLSVFAQLLPNVAKIDMSLVRGVDQNPARLIVIQAILELCTKLKSHVVTEGVETAAERDALLSVGCDWLQGYLIGKPGRTFAAPNF